VPYEDPSGRRVKALAASEPWAAEPWRGSDALERTLTRAEVLRDLRSRPAATMPRVVVLDNAGIHTSTEIQAQRPALCRQGIDLYDRPPSSPERNESEPVFKQIKHHDRPVRRHTSKAALRNSVENGFATRAQCLRQKSTTDCCAKY